MSTAGHRRIGWPRIAAPGPGPLLGAALLAALLGGCSLERTFCGSGSAACEAAVDYSRID